MKTAALGLWEGLSHSALHRSSLIVLKSHSPSLHSIVIALKVVAAKTNWWKTNVKYEFKITILLPNQKYEFKILLVSYLHQKLVSNSTSLNVCPSKNVCASTIPPGNVTEKDRRVHMLESACHKDGDRNKEFRALGGTLPKDLRSVIKQAPTVWQSQARALK